jgi:alpha-L-arabinofuranosidase
MYAQNKGTNMMTLTMDNKPVAGQDGQDGLFASSVFDKNTGEVIVKVINTSKQKQAITLNLLGIKGERTAQTITLCHDGMDDDNCLDNPEKIIPVEGTCQVDAGKNASLLLDDIPAKTFRIYKIKR